MERPVAMQHRRVKGDLPDEDWCKGWIEVGRCMYVTPCAPGEIVDLYFDPLKPGLVFLIRPGGDLLELKPPILERGSEV
ncbi:MAG: hypothetical protein AB1553_00385 [Nitrospirota bacterium]